MSDDDISTQTPEPFLTIAFVTEIHARTIFFWGGVWFFSPRGTVYVEVTHVQAKLRGK